MWSRARKRKYYFSTSGHAGASFCILLARDPATHTSRVAIQPEDGIVALTTIPSSGWIATRLVSLQAIARSL